MSGTRRNDRPASPGQPCRNMRNNETRGRACGVAGIASPFRKVRKTRPHFFGSPSVKTSAAPKTCVLPWLQGLLNPLGLVFTKLPGSARSF